MAHMRARHLRPYIEKVLKFSPLVGVLGHRQVGKTTLIETLCKTYHTLDDEESIAYLTSTAGEFLREIAGPGPIAIDEVQLMPSLFPALKEWVRKHKKTGQFLLSGSVRFTSQKAIQESLTGRIVNLELLPFTLNELLEVSPAERLGKIHRAESFSEKHSIDLSNENELRAREKGLIAYRKLGGLPGICFVRNDRLRNSRLSTQLNTMLDRDLRKVYPTRLSLSELRTMLRKLAAQQGRILSLAEAAPKGRMNSSVLQKLVDAFESLFILRRIPVRGDYSGSTLFFEDVAEYQFALGEEPNQEDLTTHMIFSVVRGALALEESEVRFFQFRTRGGVMIPIVAESGGFVTGFVPIEDLKPNRVENAAAKSFLSANSKAKVVFISEKSLTPALVDSKKMICSLAHLTE